MSRKEIQTLVIAAALLLALTVLPLYASRFVLTMSVTIAMFAVLATSWALFSGPTHYISLATAAFFGIGTYVTGLGIDYLPYWALPLVAGLVGALLAALVGFATLRLSGVYFVIFTLGLAEFVRQVVTWAQVQTGRQGFYVLGTGVNEQIIFWQLLGLGTLVYLAGWLIWRSRLGFAVRIIGNDETVARHCGINTARTKIVLFMIPGAVAAIVGAMLAPRYIYIEPSTAFSPLLSFQVVIMALLGGTGRLWGPLAGVIPFTLLWEAIARNMPNQTTLLLGVAFLVIVYVLPGGFVALYEKARRRFGREEEG